MPFIGVRGDWPVLPLEVADEGFVWYPSCDEKMKVREGEKVARHFYHVPVDSECGDESAAHVEMSLFPSGVQPMIHSTQNAETYYFLSFVE